jgi:vacuolar protein 8
LSADEVSTEITSDRLSALRTLAYSDNVDLQRSAALCFSEISERMTHPVTDGILEPLITLLRSPDVEVQTASSLALSNFALFGPAENKDVIVRGGALQALAELLLSDNVDVQCNACGCMTTLATSERNKHEIANQGTIPSLLKLSRSSDPRVQRNATGALLNLTHLERNRYELARCGAIPVFVSLVQSRDPDVQFYCAAALSNMAVQVEHRVLMIQIGGGEILRHLILLLSSTVEKVRDVTLIAICLTTY